MNSATRRHIWSWLAASLLALVPSVSRADVIYIVTVNTTDLQAKPGSGPYYLDFQFNDGSGTGGDGNNTATISNFQGASLIGNPYFQAGGITVTGSNPPSAFTLTDSTFLNEVTQQFAPGAALSFQVDLTQNVSANEIANAPDEFSFGLLAGTPPAGIATVDLTGALVRVDITVPTLNVNTSAVDPASGFDIPLPTVSPAAVPEPATLALLLIGVGGLGAYGWRKGRT